jgi:Tfp pilus assembly protein PilV
MRATVKDKPYRRRRRTVGTTLTEVVVASTLLVVAVVPILRALTIAQMTGTSIERKTQSLILAQSKLDELRAKCVHHYDDSFARTSETLSGSYLCNTVDDAGPDLRQVAVSVGYDSDENGRLSDSEIEVRLATCIARTQ